MAKAPKLILRYEGVFDFQEIYDYIVNFFKDKHYDYLETGWKEKDASPQGRERTVKMKPEKNITEYLKHKYKLEWKSVDAHNVAVEQDGKSKQHTHARLHIHIEAELAEDWQGLGKKHEKLKGFFDKHVFKREKENVYMEALEKEMQALLDGIKQTLGMQTTKY